MAKYKIIPSSRTIVHSPISIGHKAEKGVEAIEFDLTVWVEAYGSGTTTIIMRRWGDAIPYPIALEIDENNKATWTLSDIDTAKAGMAYAQLNYIVGDEVVKKSDIYTFRVMDSLTGEGEPPEAYESWLEHLTHLAAEAMAEVLDIEGIVTDKTLTVDGGIADAKKTGDEISAIKADLEDLESQGGVPSSVRQALVHILSLVPAYSDDPSADKTVLESWASVVTAITISQSTASISGSNTVLLTATTTPSGSTVAWESSDESVATVVNGLVTGVGNGTAVITASSGGMTASCTVTVSGFVSLSSISAVYTPTSSVYTDDTLDSLKNDLVVTATYSDNASETLADTDYVLTGTLAHGSNTITVSYGGKTTTVTVTASKYHLYDYIYNSNTSTGTNGQSESYVDTGLTHSPSFNTLNLEFECVNNNEASNKSEGLIGTFNSSTSNLATCIWYARANKAGYSVFSLGNSAKLENVPANTRAVITYTFVDGGQSTISDGTNTVNVATVSKSSVPVTNSTLVLAGSRGTTDGAPYGLLSNARTKLGYIKFKDPENSNALVYHFIPCHNVETDKWGFYEAVNSVFYPASGDLYRCANWE